MLEVYLCINFHQLHQSEAYVLEIKLNGNHHHDCHTKVTSIQNTTTFCRWKVQHDIKVNKLDQPVLTTLTDPRINLKRKYPHLSGSQFQNEGEKDQYPVYTILRAGDIAKIKLSGFISGITGEWVVEKTLFG